MLKYFLYQKNPSSHYIYIDLLIDNVKPGILQLQLPAWRPGRYELGNFAKNIKRVDVFDENNEPVNYTKINKDLWQIDVNRNCSLKVTYSYYAAELNAGSCFADASQLYINPVHCCLFVVGRREEEHQVEIKIPENYKIACALPLTGNTLVANDYEELVDSPFMASAQISTVYYEVGGIRFYLHFNGECKPDFEKIKNDFSAFTQKSILFWNDYPYDEFHFLFQILPIKFYHGVEHKKSTVIAIGPGYAINSGTTYEDILGVACHELFHVWNVKTIRPNEMMPYDFTKENYSRTGYVYEGFTTYYGDKILLASKVFSLEQYFTTLQERLTKHFHNFGRYNLSVADSSWETWLDGYIPGAPYRKTNIYDEGSLIAFMLDVSVLKATGNKKSLRDVCVLLYDRFGKKQKGYIEADILSLVNEVSGKDHAVFFKTYINTANDYEIPLTDAFTYLGIEMEKRPSALVCEDVFGFKVIDNGLNCKVSLVAPYAPAWKAGIFAGDEILAVNNMMVKGNLNNWLSYFKDQEEIKITLNSAEKIKEVQLSAGKKAVNWFFNPILKLNNSKTTEQTHAFESWQKF